MISHELKTKHPIKPVKVLLDHGAYQNIGDVSMLETVIRQCRKRFPSLNLHVIKNDFPSDVWNFKNVVTEPAYMPRPLFKKVLWFTKRCHSYKTDRFFSKVFLSYYSKTTASTTLYYKGEKMKVRDFCSRYDGYLVSGGGNLNDTFYKVLFSKLILIKEFLQLNKPVMLTGQQLGPFTSLFFKQVTIKLLKNVNFMGLRDPGESAALCRKHGLKFNVMGDDSLQLEPAEDSVVQHFLSENELKPKGFIAVNVRYADYAIQDERTLLHLASILQVLSNTLKMPLAIVPISFARHDSDVQTAIHMQTHLKTLRVLRPSFFSPALIKGIIGQAFGAIGTSFHFCTYSLSQGVPAICIYKGDYYQQKARSIEMLWQGLALAWDINEITKATIPAFLRFYNDPHLRKQLLKKSAQLKNNWQNIFENKMSKTFGLKPCD
jgi:polysaccharide pyruvyl transferase WcaK-like protein